VHALQKVGDYGDPFSLNRSFTKRSNAVKYIIPEYLFRYSIIRQNASMLSKNAPLTPVDLPHERAEQIAQIFAALGDPTRARIVYLLTQGEHSVNVLAEIVGVSPSAVSHHLARLRDVRLVKARRRKQQVFYSVDDEHVSTLYRQVHH
jgi:ArsR family transcriptional regulator